MITSGRRRKAFVVVAIVAACIFGKEREEKIGSIPTEHKTTKNNALHEKLHFPSMEKGGGIILFFHIVKTGGTTVKGNLARAPSIDYMMSMCAQKDPHQFENHKLKMESWVAKGTKGRIKVWEIHAGSCPSYKSLEDEIATWRADLTKMGVPFFFFTILRDPVDWAVSAFNHYCISFRYPDCREAEPTEEWLLNVSIHNPQCRFLTKGWHVLSKNKTFDPTTEECKELGNSLVNNLDWVGNTLRMNETAHVLRSVLPVGSLTDFTFHLPIRKPRKAIAKSSLSKDVLSYLRKISSSDVSLQRYMESHFAL